MPRKEDSRARRQPSADRAREANSNGITEGRSNGWRLIYCKGCEGEQLEFVQALGPVKRVFDSTREARLKAVAR